MSVREAIRHNEYNIGDRISWFSDHHNKRIEGEIVKITRKKTYRGEATTITVRPTMPEPGFWSGYRRHNITTLYSNRSIRKLEDIPF